MRPSSLAFRLTVSSAIVSLVLLVSAGLLLSYLFQVTIERNFDARLQAVLDGLLANVEVNEDGAPVILGAIADTRFKLPLSGWYWQVSATDGRPDHELVSELLLENRLRPGQLASMARDEFGVARFYLIDQSGNQLRGIEQHFTLFGGKRQFSFLVAGNFDELKREIAAFTQTLWAVLAVLGLGLLAAILVQVRYGLRPLRRLQDELAAIRSGRRSGSPGAIRWRSSRCRPSSTCCSNPTPRSSIGAHPGGQSRACAEDAAQRARQRGAHPWWRPRPQGRRADDDHERTGEHVSRPGAAGGAGVVGSAP